MTAKQVRWFDRGRRAFRDGLEREALAALYRPGSEGHDYATRGWWRGAEEEARK